MNTREEYLVAAVEKLRPWFTKAKLDIPPVKVSCGFGSKTPMKTLGECWSSECTFDGTRHIFVTPMHPDAVSSLGTLAHELLHACLPDDAKHGPKFKDGMKAIGLEGKAIHASPGPELQLFIEKIVDELGDYPNPQLKPKQKSKKEKANSKKSFKLFCPRKRNGEKSCILTDKTAGGDYTVTVSRKMLKLACPICVCGAEMEMESDDFELYKLGENT
jgi:hypothetical protein